MYSSARGVQQVDLKCMCVSAVQESKAAAAMTERIMADVQRSNTEVASLNAYLQVS